jgi:hypothetical protein
MTLRHAAALITVNCGTFFCATQGRSKPVTVRLLTTPGTQEKPRRKIQAGLGFGGIAGCAIGTCCHAKTSAALTVVNFRAESCPGYTATIGSSRVTSGGIQSCGLIPVEAGVSAPN